MKFFSVHPIGYNFFELLFFQELAESFLSFYENPKPIPSLIYTQVQKYLMAKFQKEKLLPVKGIRNIIRQIRFRKLFSLFINYIKQAPSALW